MSITPGWFVADDQGRIVAIIESAFGMYRVHEVSECRWLGNRVDERDALRLAGHRPDTRTEQEQP